MEFKVTSRLRLLLGLTRVMIAPLSRGKLMRKHISPWVCAAGFVSLLSSCVIQKERVEPSVFSEEWWKPMVQKIVARLELSPGERVFSLGDPELHGVLPELFASEVELAGGVYVGTVSGRAGPYGPVYDEEFNQAARRASLAINGEKRAAYQELLRSVPVGIMLPGPSPADPAYAAMQDLLWEQLGQHRTVHFHWAGAYQVEDLSYPIGSTAGAVPTNGERQAAFYRRAILEEDYEDLYLRQDAFESEARTGEIKVTTPAGTDIRFQIGDRPVNRQDGDISGIRAESGAILIDREIEFPTGAVRVAPIESSVNGVIIFPRSNWNDERVDDLRLVFEAGEIVSMTAAFNIESVEAELAGEGAREFREFGLGLNPLLAVPRVDPWLPHFGYGAGVIRVSLGDNSEIGGNVEGDYVRWNFLLDASVSINNRVWVKDGRLVRF